MGRGSSLLLVGLILGLPGSAHAGTVGRLFNPDEEYDAVSFGANAGERNQLTVTVAAKTVTIADSGAPLTVEPGSGCTAIDQRTARCARRPHVYIDLGDGDDGVRLSYSAPVHGDFAGDFAEVLGAEGHDVLRGGTAAETFDGGPGPDFVHGGAGNDDLTGGDGRDQLFGGPGDDFINPRDASGSASDDISCGAGRDGINADVDPTDLVHRDCEKLASVGGGLSVAPTFASRSGGTWVMPCRGIGNGRSSLCRAHVVLTDRAGHVLAEGRGTMHTKPYRAIRMRTSPLRVAVRLTPLGRRMLFSGRYFVVTERASTYERVPGLATTRQHPRFNIAWP